MEWKIMIMTEERGSKGEKMDGREGRKGENQGNKEERMTNRGK